ncbi:hypothetical protein C900_04807 [Fulvivirga imtechensis AK7]|uniref:Flippase-like domain-containing protein n=1 Tax=Fulvivirga imtechensis AK7 TaxID=1237149 RepID=L8JQD0_9BACT|nr:lysylphosphatidylglycerol synthase domain-containing protein [Fulvivirga imtechensis]ELR69582.1 hypothetical protein C900_04807 [Fulvivirga imtechensis AK7]
MPSLKKASLNKPLWITIKLVVLVLLVGFICLKLNKSRNVHEEMWQGIWGVFREEHKTLLFVILLMPFNWGLEAVKWKALTSPLIKMKFLKALEAVLTGLSLGFITPHGIGDYLGRIMQNDAKGRFRLIGAVMLGRICQMIPTALFGLIGIYYFFKDLKLVFYITLATLFISIILYMIAKSLSKKNNSLGFFRKLRFYTGMITEYRTRIIIQVIGLSMARYVVFAFQFLIILKLFLPDLNIWVGFAGVTWILFMKSVLPTFNFLSDLGVREFSAVYFFDIYQVDLISVISASLVIWIINILIPSIVGAPFSLKMKLQTK